MNIMMLMKLFKWLTIATFLLIAGGCAKNNVRTTNEIANSGLPRPQQVLVYNFAVTPGDVKASSSIFSKMGRSISGTSQTEEEIQVGREVSDALASELFQKIRDMGLNPVRAVDGVSVPQGSLLVTGQFVNIDEGNAVRRNAIGLGIGKSSLDSQVSVLAPGPSGYEELIGFQAHSDSGQMPGAAVTGPVGAASGASTAAVIATNAAVGGVKSYKSSSAQQAKKMAENIAAELGRYFVQQGWISPDQAK